MLDRLVGLFSGKKPAQRKAVERGALASSSEHQDAFARLNAIAPLADGAPSPSVSLTDAQPQKSIVFREAILGKDQRVAGYGFSLRYEVNQRVRAASTNVQRLYDDVLLRNLQSMDVQRLLEHRFAFVDVSASSLDKPLFEALQPHGVVYVVGPNSQLVANPAFCLERLMRLKALGYRIGLQGDEVDHPDMSPFVDLADFLSLDVGGNDIPSINHQMATAVRRNAAIKCVATHIQTQDEFGVCARMPFSFFQGPFITSRAQWRAPRLDTGRIKLLELLNKLRGDAEVAELTTLIKQDPALSFKLLRYINSPGMGLIHKIGTLDQALIVLGRQKLYRWLTLLLFTSGESQGLDSALMENALVRARLAEMLARYALPADERDELFVAGVFSLLDIVMAMPMEAVLKQVSLPPLVNQALLHQRGKYAPFLALAIACEQSNETGIVALSDVVGLDARQVNDLHLEALLWAQQVGE